MYTSVRNNLILSEKSPWVLLYSIELNMILILLQEKKVGYIKHPNLMPLYAFCEEEGWVDKVECFYLSFFFLSVGYLPVWVICWKFFLVIAKIDRRLLSEKNIKHNDYINTLFNNEQIYHKVKTIRSVNRELGSYEVIVTRHLAFDDKRYMHEDGVTCYASGHY